MKQFAKIGNKFVQIRADFVQIGYLHSIIVREHGTTERINLP